MSTHEHEHGPVAPPVHDDYGPPDPEELALTTPAPTPRISTRRRCVSEAVLSRRRLRQRISTNSSPPTSTDQTLVLRGWVRVRKGCRMRSRPAPPGR